MWSQTAEMAGPARLAAASRAVGRRSTAGAGTVPCWASRRAAAADADARLGQPDAATLATCTQRRMDRAAALEPRLALRRAEHLHGDSR